MFLYALLAACTDPSKDALDDTSGDPSDDTAPDEEPTWSYDGETGPEHWGELSEEWADCSAGTAQSPIDLLPAEFVDAAAGPWAIDWGSTGVHAYNSGHYVRYEVDAGSTLTTADGVYDLLQFHFHGLSEHTIDGVHLAAEIHFVHALQTDPSRYAVVGIFLGDDLGIESDAFAADGVLHFPEALALPHSEETTDLGGTLDLAAVFGVATANGYASYVGSLTTPPCTEGVTFYLMGEGLLLPTADIDAFHAVYDHNYRPVQPLNGRVVTLTPPLE